MKIVIALSPHHTSMAERGQAWANETAAWIGCVLEGVLPRWEAERGWGAEMSFSSFADPPHEPATRQAGAQEREQVSQSDIWYPSGQARKHISAEFIGSILLQFLRGCAVVNSMDVTLNGTSQAVVKGEWGVLTAALGAGFAYAALLYATAGSNGSGGKLNPAISAALVVARRMDAPTFLAEVAAQFSGAMLGGMLVWAAIPREFMYYRGRSAEFHLEGAAMTESVLRGMLADFMMTMMLNIVYLATAADFHNRAFTRSMWPLVVGLCSAAGMLGGVAGTSGGAMNPASAVAAAIVYSDYRNLPWYLLATMSGALCGAFLYITMLGIGMNDAPLRAHTVFEGVRQETKEFGRQNFIMYLVVDHVHRLSADQFETRFCGRVCYPQMYNDVSQVEGLVAHDGRLLELTQVGGTLDKTRLRGFMMDVGHIAGVQAHANGEHLAYVALKLVGPAMARRVLDQIDKLHIVEAPARSTSPPEPKKHSLQLC